MNKFNIAKLAPPRLRGGKILLISAFYNFGREKIPKKNFGVNKAYYSIFFFGGLDRGSLMTAARLRRVVGAIGFCPVRVL